MRTPDTLLAAGLAFGLAAPGCHPNMDPDTTDPEACLAQLTDGNNVNVDGKYYATPGEADAEPVSASGTYTDKTGSEYDRWGIARDLHVVLEGDIDEVVGEDDIARQLIPFAYNPATVDPTDPNNSWVAEDVWPAHIENSEGIFDDPEDGDFMLVAEPGEDWFNDPTDVRVVVTRSCKEIVAATNGDETHEMYDADSGLYVAE